MKTTIRLGITVFCLVMAASCSNSKTTPDNTVLVSQGFSIPLPDMVNFENADRKNYSAQGAFDDVGASFSIHVTARDADSLGTVLDSIKVVLDKGAAGCKFSSKIDSPEINHGSKEKFETSTILTVGYFKKGVLRSNSEFKIFTVNSKGEVRRI